MGTPNEELYAAILRRAWPDVLDNVLTSSRLSLHCYYHPFLILKGQLSGGAEVYRLFSPPLRFLVTKK